MIAAPDPLVCAVGAKMLDEEASAKWGLNPYALVEAAGRACAEAFVSSFQKFHSITVLAGKGNNAADALVMLRTLILNGYARASDCSVFAVQVSNAPALTTPLFEATLAVYKLGVRIFKWDGVRGPAALARADVIIDGICGTGITGALRGGAREMVQALNAVKQVGPFIVSIDIPSGNFDGWRTGMSIVQAHATLAIQPRKLCLYTPAARPRAGMIIPVNGIFPPALTGRYREAELVTWESSSARIPPVAKTAYKYERGVVEIRAGSPDAAGAARLAALGAQSAGAGLVRLLVDPSLYPIIAPACSGVMVETADRIPESPAETRRFTPDAVLLGPGWGRDGDRARVLEACLPLEKSGVPLILDADAIALAKDRIFHGNVILTPHAGEFAAYTGLSKDEILDDPIPALRRFAAEKKTHILFKSHVLYAASPDGRIGIIDGMNPALAAGGSGDVLAGFCAAIAARRQSFDGYACICAAASLLIEAAASPEIAGAFIDPAELTKAAAVIAGKAWI